MQPINGYETLYEITNDGRVWSHPKGGRNGNRGLWMSPVIDGTGYAFVYLTKDRKRKMHKIHRLVAQAFIPNVNGKPEVNHKDGIKLNNLMSNLEWATRSENMQHAYDTGLNHGTKGSENKLAKLTESQVLEIRKLREEGMTLRALAIQFNVAKGNIVFITTRKTWRHI